MKSLIFAICFLCLIVFGCNDRASSNQNRLEFPSDRDSGQARYQTQEYYEQYYPSSFPNDLWMDVPRIKPMKLPPVKKKPQSNEISDPFLEWPSPMLLPEEK
jgi:hypothetical protein